MIQECDACVCDWQHVYRFSHDWPKGQLDQSTNRKSYLLLRTLPILCLILDRYKKGENSSSCLSASRIWWSIYCRKLVNGNSNHLGIGKASWRVASYALLACEFKLTWRCSPTCLAHLGKASSRVVSSMFTYNCSCLYHWWIISLVILKRLEGAHLIALLFE